MNIYLISQTVNNDYDTYDSAVVCAQSEEAARNTHPRPGRNLKHDDSWCDPADVTVRYLGIAAQHLSPGVICPSFNAR